MRRGYPGRLYFKFSIAIRLGCSVFGHSLHSHSLSGYYQKRRMRTQVEGTRDLSYRCVDGGVQAFSFRACERYRGAEGGVRWNRGSSVDGEMKNVRGDE